MEMVYNHLRLMVGLYQIIKRQKPAPSVPVATVNGEHQDETGDNSNRNSSGKTSAKRKAKFVKPPIVGMSMKALMFMIVLLYNDYFGLTGYLGVFFNCYDSMIPE